MKLIVDKMEDNEVNSKALKRKLKKYVVGSKDYWYYLGLLNATEVFEIRIERIIEKLKSEKVCWMCGKLLNGGGGSRTNRSKLCSNCHCDTKNGMHGSMRNHFIKRMDKSFK